MSQTLMDLNCAKAEGRRLAELIGKSMPHIEQVEIRRQAAINQGVIASLEFTHRNWITSTSDAAIAVEKAKLPVLQAEFDQAGRTAQDAYKAFESGGADGSTASTIAQAKYCTAGTALQVASDRLDAATTVIANARAAILNVGGSIA